MEFLEFLYLKLFAHEIYGWRILLGELNCELYVFKDLEIVFWLLGLLELMTIVKNHQNLNFLKSLKN